MATNNANITITSNNIQAIQQNTLLKQSFTSLNNVINKSKVVIENSNASWSDYAQGVYASVELIKKAGRGIKTAYDYLREGTNLLEAQQNFKSYTESIGKNADELVARFRKATRNQITDIELMKSATKAFSGSL